MRAFHGMSYSFLKYSGSGEKNEGKICMLLLMILFSWFRGGAVCSLSKNKACILPIIVFFHVYCGYMLIRSVPYLLTGILLLNVTTVSLSILCCPLQVQPEMNIMNC